MNKYFHMVFVANNNSLTNVNKSFGHIDDDEIAVSVHDKCYILYHILQNHSNIIKPE